MKVLILNQAFYPDVVAVAQYSADLAVALVDRGHDVTVVASVRAYDCPSQRFASSETWRGVRIYRVGSTAFGKSAHWRRVADIASFYVFCLCRLARLPRFDVVIAMTVPPLIAVLASLYVQFRGGALVSWIMDLNPDEAIAAGALGETTFVARLLLRLLKFSLASSAETVVLDRFMFDRVAARGGSAKRISVIPPWSHDAVVRFDEAARTRFRSRYGLAGKFAVMYSGNHSPCHPLTTLLEAAKAMATESDIVFLFIGGGSEFAMVKDFALRHSLPNVICLPYQPLNELPGSLSAADLHVVLMGDKFVGTVHPCKIYNILAIGCPFLYIGPSPNHITEIVTPSSGSAYFAKHGQVEQVVSYIREAILSGQHRDPRNARIAMQFSGSTIIPQMVSVIERSHNGIICTDATQTGKQWGVRRDGRS